VTVPTLSPRRRRSAPEDAQWRAKVAATGSDYRNDYIFFLRLEAGRIAEVWEQFDSLYAFEKLLGTAN
jgi:ketosteroid isomerase-like protein